MKPKLALVLFICLNLILCASAQKKIQKAREKDPQYQYNMGLFFLNSGNIDEAIKYFNKALSLNPNYDYAFCSLGLAYSMKGDFEKSVKYLQDSLRINPALSDAHNYLGTAYQEMGFLDKAEQEFRIAVSDKNYKSRELPYYNLARLCIIKERLPEALDYIEKSIEMNSRLAMAYNLKGTILEKMNDLEGAIGSYKQAVKIVKDEINFNFNLAVAYFKNNEFSKAKEIFETISLKVSDPEMKEKINQYLKMIK